MSLTVVDDIGGGIGGWGLGGTMGGGSKVDMVDGNADKRDR